MAYFPNEVSESGKMTDDRIQAILKQEIQSAVGYVGGEISEQRRKAMEYYLGEKFGNEVEGRSEVVDSTVQDVIESVMPDFVEMFASGDQAVTFSPGGPEDVEFAAQASDMVNHVWLHDNDGYGITHDWIKDGLLAKNGFIKVYWDDSEVTERETYENLNSAALQELIDDDEVEIVEAEERQAASEIELMAAPDGILYDVACKRTSKKGRARVFCLPPEEFLISRRAVTLDDAVFMAHRFRKTISDLREMGYPEDVLERIPSSDDHDYNEERTARFDADDEYPDNDHSLDPSTRYVWVYECYVLMDADGDGIAERRVVTVAGAGYEILENEEVDDHPFVSLTPIRMGHKFFGRSLADLTFDLQELKSTVWRQLMDNMYLQNNGRMGVNDTVNLDDMLTNRPGGIVRVQGATPPAQAISQIVTPPLGNYAFPILEYLDSVRELRTGVTRYSQGLDAESLNKTATGMNQMLGRSQKRMLLMARTMAEGGFKQAMKKILRLLISHQDSERTVRLRGKWVPVSPKHWNADMDAIVHVGLGHGTQEQQAMVYEKVLGIQNSIIAQQGGPNGPLVTLDNVYSTLKEATTAAGIKNTDLHFTDPQSPEAKAAMQNQRPKPDPRMVEVQQKGEIEAQKLKQQAELDRAEEARKRQREVEDAQLKDKALMLEHQRKLQEIALEDERERLKAGIQLDIEEAKASQQIDLERMKAEAAAELQNAQNTHKTTLEREKFEDARNARDNPPEVVALEEVREEIREASRGLGVVQSDLKDANESIKDALPVVADAVAKISAPKTVKYDKDGKVTGVEVAGEFKKAVRGKDGRIEGLK